MNIDRCHEHVPTAPGQSVCTCLDLIMWQRHVIQVQSQLIAKLLAERGNPRVLINTECP